jgi:hypothetical protein
VIGLHDTLVNVLDKHLGILFLIEGMLEPSRTITFVFYERWKAAYVQVLQLFSPACKNLSIAV